MLFAATLVAFVLAAFAWQLARNVDATYKFQPEAVYIFKLEEHMRSLGSICDRKNIQLRGKLLDMSGNARGRLATRSPPHASHACARRLQFGILPIFINYFPDREHSSG